MVTRRHAAALALLGWYLMVPPFRGSSNTLNQEAPLSRWKVWSAHDSAADCESNRVYTYKQTKEDTGPQNRLMHQPILLAQCIETVDPRLNTQ